MKIKSFLAKPFANYISRQIKKSMTTAVEDQHHIFQQLIKTAQKTEFGKDHDFASIKTYEDFIQKVSGRVVNKRVLEALINAGSMLEAWRVPNEKLLQQ